MSKQSLTGGNWPIKHSSWPLNLKGGYKVISLPLKHKRHEGVRCYGYHTGSKCRKYDFSRNPAIPQAALKDAA